MLRNGGHWRPGAAIRGNPMTDDPSKGYRTRNVTKQRFYVYAIQVDGVVRYIGKGSNGREHFHAIEARRINRQVGVVALTPTALLRISTGSWPRP
jgi:hypothetical protein